jgi:hypothetical protein
MHDPGSDSPYDERRTGRRGRAGPAQPRAAQPRAAQPRVGAPSRTAGGGSNRLLLAVFALLVAMTAVAAFAIGGLLSLRSSVAAADRYTGAPQRRAAFAVAVGELAGLPPTGTTPAANEQPGGGGAGQPPLVDLTPTASGETPTPTPTSTRDDTPETGGASPTPHSSCSAGTTPTPSGSSSGGIGGVPVIPLCP